MDPLLAYHTALIADLESRGGPELEAFIAALKSVDTAGGRVAAAPSLAHPAMAHLEAALSRVRDAALLATARDLDWAQVFADDSIDPLLAEGMLAAPFAGRKGRFRNDEMASGLFLLAPGVSYPLHTHAAREVYFCHAGRLRLRHGTGGRPFILEPGDYSITPSHRLHALDVVGAPVLLSYIWIGDLNGANWWWSQDADGAWQRSGWKRVPGASWQLQGAEAVTAERMAEAHAGLD